MAIPRQSSRSSRGSRNRHFSCTHLTISRLWVETSDERCSLCYRQPFLGWLYRCTQDYNGFLPASDFHIQDNTKRLERDADLYTLSPSIVEAATEGHYTHAELEILWKQKIEVRKLIQQIRPTTSSSISTASSSSSLAATATYSTLPSTESDTDPELEPESEIPSYLDSLKFCRAPLEPIQEVSIDLEKDHKIIPFARTTLPLPCNFKVCHNCRPNHRERAWISLNGVLKTQYRLLVPPRHEIQNKKIADVNVVKNLGARTSFLPPDDHDDVQHLFRAPIKRNSRTEFQGTVQRLLKNKEPDTVRYTYNDGAGNEGRRGLSREKSYHNLAGMVNTPSMKTEASSALSADDSVSFDNGDTTFSSIDDTLAAPDTSESASSFLGRRPLYFRRGFERMTSIKIPTRSAVSHRGESISSLGQSTNRSTLSAPGIMERRSVEQEKMRSVDDEEDNKNSSFKFQPLPEIVVEDSDLLRSVQSATDLRSGSAPDSKSTLT